MVEIKTLAECKQQLALNQEEFETNTKNLELALTNISFLYQAILVFTEEKDKDKLYQLFLKKVSQMLGAEISIVYGLNKDSEEYFALATLGTKYSEQNSITGPWKNTFIEDVLINDKNIIHNSEQVITGKLPAVVERYKVFSSLSAAVKTDAGVEAIVQFNRLHPEGFTINDERLLLILLDRLNSMVANINIQQDLKSKTDELVKMNNLMVDRELKMIELKKEIEQLKA